MPQRNTTRCTSACCRIRSDGNRIGCFCAVIIPVFRAVSFAFFWLNREITDTLNCTQNAIKLRAVDRISRSSRNITGRYIDDLAFIAFRTDWHNVTGIGSLTACPSVGYAHDFALNVCLTFFIGFRSRTQSHRVQQSSLRTCTQSYTTKGSSLRFSTDGQR